MKRLGSIACVLAVLSSSPSARADEETARCIASYESGQELRQSGKIVAARAELEICSRDVCPALARRDCLTWLRQVDDAMPTIVVGVRTTDGLDVATNELFVDGRSASRGLNGSPLAIDPGEHLVRVVLADGRAAEEKLVIALGEKNRLVRFTLPAATKPAPNATSAPSGEPDRSSDASSGRSLLPFVLGGVALGLVGAGVAFDVVGSNQLSDLRSTCAPACDVADLDSARTKIIVGDSLIAAGIVTGAIAVVLLLREPSRASAIAWRGALAW